MNEQKTPESKDRPTEVLCAVQLAFASLVVALIAIPLQPGVMKSQSLGFLILVMASSLLFTSFILFMIWRGQNWARLLFIILFVIGVPFSFIGFLKTLPLNPVYAVINLIQISLQMMAVVLLLQHPARNWFKSVKLRKLMNYQVT